MQGLIRIAGGTSVILLSSLVTLSQGVASDCPLLRASNEALPRARVPRARRTLEVTPSSPLLMGNSPHPLTTITLCSTMAQTNAYHRGLYRLPVTYPAMYCGMLTVGEGTITNLSAVGCTIETDQPLLADQDVALCLLLPDRHESLPIELAHVRWVNGHTSRDRIRPSGTHCESPAVGFRIGPDGSTLPHDSTTTRNFLADCGRTVSAQQNFNGGHFWGKRRTSLQDA